jgi:arylsulfatase A-like enzyme
VLRKAGYYTANFKKTDYNIGGRADKDAWHSFADNAWELRGPGQPFFQVLNFEDSHESRAFGDIEHTRHAPADMVLRRYHPDIPEIRKNYAKYQDAVEMMDAKVGKALERLKQAGLEEDTIVIFNSDHGGVLPRSKRWLYNSGTHAPMAQSGGCRGARAHAGARVSGAGGGTGTRVCVRIPGPDG